MDFKSYLVAGLLIAHVCGYVSLFEKITLGIDCTCPPGHYIKADCLGSKPAQCQACRNYSFNMFRDHSTSCQDCKHSCAFQASVLHKCTPTSDLACQCNTGFKAKRGACFPVKEYECPPGHFVNEMHRDVPLRHSRCEPCPPRTYNSNRDLSTSCTDCSHDCLTGAIITAYCNATSDMVCECKPGYRIIRYPVTNQWACTRSMDTSTNLIKIITDTPTNLIHKKNSGRGRNVQDVPMLIYIVCIFITVYFKYM